MKMRTQKTFTFLLLLSFLFAQVTESAFPASAMLGFLKKSPSLIKKLPPLSKLPRKPNGRIDFSKPIVIGENTKTQIVNVADFSLDLAIERLQDYDFLDSSLSQPDSRDKLDITYLTIAVENIQLNFNLPVTGKLDLNTNNIISKPRCDFPNKLQGTSTLMKLANKQISLKPWWRNEKKNNLTYAFGNNVPENVKSWFQATFNGWSNEGVLKFTETKVIKDSDILIAFVEVDGKDGVVGSWDCIFG